MKWIIIILLVFYSNFSNAQQIIELCVNSKTNFNYSVTSNTKGNWFWILNNDTISRTNTVNITWKDTGTFNLIVVFINDCKKVTKYHYVTVLPCYVASIFFPNAFTPNGDGLNDKWSPIPVKIVELKWNVWNRWGEKVFETNKIGDKWDGTYKGVEQGIGGFVFQCWWKDINGKTGYEKGNLVLIR